jgi:hypothetical protein
MYRFVGVLEIHEWQLLLDKVWLWFTSLHFYSLSDLYHH